MGEAHDEKKTEKKREASSPADKPPPTERHKGDDDHTVHPSVQILHTNEVAGSPVSRNNSHVLTAKTIISTYDEMGADGSPSGSPSDYNKLLQLFIDLEKRVGVLESELKSKNSELLSVRLENASLQTQMSQVADVQSSQNSAGDSSQPVSSQPSSPMLTENVSVTVSDTENAASADVGSGATDWGNTPAPPPPPSLRLRDHGPNVEAHGPNSVARPPPVPGLNGGQSSDAGSVPFSPVVSVAEQRRIKRCKGMLHGLKHIPSTVDTLLILDSNGRSISGEDIDGSGNKICARAIGGLCVSATTTALTDLKITYPKIKTLAFGLGTNDHLHARQHPGDIEVYVQLLNTAARKVFPEAKIHFILPFSAIKGLNQDFVNKLDQAIRNSGVGWKILKTPSMKGNLEPPSFIHL